MHVSDLVGQYNQTTTSGTEKLTGTKGVENLVSSLRSLTKGNIFEGTVSSMKNGRVTLALSNGQQLSARMEGKVSLSLGQSMFFQVKSNDGTQIAIRPFVVDGNGVNFTLMTALNVAGLAVDASHLSMVNKMMEEQMPIDRNSLQQMARLVSANPDIDVQTLVQLKKLGIPITPENASQFENYLDDKAGIPYYGTDGLEYLREKDDDKIAFTGFCCYTSNPLQMAEKYGEHGVNCYNVETVGKLMKQKADEGYLNIVAVHAGLEHVNYPHADHIQDKKDFQEIP